MSASHEVSRKEWAMRAADPRADVLGEIRGGEDGVLGLEIVMFRVCVCVCIERMRVPACLLACLPACLPARLPACLPACPPACLPTRSSDGPHKKNPQRQTSQ